MSRVSAFLLVLALWAAIYLPGLGSTELKGEEGRRILPAMTMLETGDWLVPYVGGKPFLRKPPLMNWLIALSFKATGVRNEWTARLPSVLAVLALGMTMVGVAGHGWMSIRTSATAAVMAMTTFGLLAKARFAGAEIEGVYAPLFGIAMVWWLAGWAREWSPWKLWLVPAVFLGLAALAKGPLHLLFFYGIVMVVLWKEKRFRALLHPAHVVAILLVVGIFAAWAIPYFQTEAASKATKVWKDQMANRVTENHFEWKSYLTNLPRGLGDLLPWVFFAPILYGPFVRRELFAPRNVPDGSAPVGDIKPAVLRGTLLASSVLFLVLLLIPGILPRYVLPLGIPLALVLATGLRDSRFERWPLKLGAVMAMLMILFALFAIPVINRHDNLRPLAQEIDAVVPTGATLTLYDPGYQAWIFYLHTPFAYAPSMEDIPERAAAVLSRGGEKERRKFEEKRPDLKVTHSFKARDGTELLLLEPSACQKG